MSDERYQQRQQRVKDKVDARVAGRDERGIIIVFTGNGKAKPPQHLVRQHAQLVTEKSGRRAVY